MKFIYSFLLSLGTCTMLFAQQSFSSFPVAIDKAEYDDREAVFVADDNKEAGVFLSDNNVVHFIKLDASGQPILDLKQNMPLNYASVKRAGVGTLSGNYYCYFLQGNKKILALQADVTGQKLTYITFPFTGGPILFIAAGLDYLYVVTSSGDIKNELTVYKYTSPADPKITKVKTTDVDLYKTLGINANKATEQIAVIPLNKPVHFTQSGQVTKAYYDDAQLLITHDAPEGETRILTLTDEVPKVITIKSSQVLDKKNVFRSLLFQEYIYQLTVSAKGVSVQSFLLGDQTPVKDDGGQVEPDFYFESSYSARIGYNRERKASTKIEMNKSFTRADVAGLGILETSNGKLMLVAGCTTKNSITDPNVDSGDNEQKGQLNVNITLERNYADLHLPSYTTDQNALLKFKKEIWVYTYWALDENSHQLSKAMPEDILLLDESLDLFYRDPLNNVAPAIWKQDKTFLFGFYNSKNQNYNLYKMAGKQPGGNMNRR